MRQTLASIGFLILTTLCAVPAFAQYRDWKHSGSVFILTTPECADLPATLLVKQFPVLVRLQKDSFDFTKAQPQGEDIRFATSDGVPLAYQIDEWDATRGEAVMWVRVPKIVGNARQELRVFWGKSDAKSESNGAAVFNESNGYVSVWHLGDTIHDDVGTLMSQDVGTTPVAGMIGKARHLAGKQGIFCGEKIESLPSDGAAHSTEAWFRSERPNSTIIGWGNEGGGRGSKVRMQFRSPPHVHIDSDFSDVDAPERLLMRDLIHVAHTYANGEGHIYINGKLTGSAKPTLSIKSPSRLWLGGWYHNYDFVCARDELSKGQSTFMVEMTETARILNSASDRSLVILDEIGRGTSTYDGISLAWAVTEFLHDQIRCRTLFATHYHELTELTKTLPDTSNWNVAIREHGDDIVFLHKIVEGPADKSYGIHVAKIAGLPRDVAERASVILAQLESDHVDESGKVKIPERKKKSRDRQLSLFIEPDHPVIEKLKSLDIEQLTPIAALQKLNEFRQELAK